MLKIDQEIINQTRRRCPKWNICLAGDMSYCGKVKQEGGDFLVMESLPSYNPSNCPYSYTVKDKNSDVYICSCPVRKEIYRKYGK